MEIKRDFYLNQLIERQHNGLVKVVTGLRRVGKSFLLFNLFKKHLLSTGVKESQIVEVALDQARFERLLNPLELAKYIRKQVKDKGWHYVLIDEIQLSLKVRKPGVRLSDIAPEDRKNAYITFYDVLNEFRAMPNVDVYVTGSNSKMLSKDVATNFRDRGQGCNRSQAHRRLRLRRGRLPSFRRLTSPDTCARRSRPIDWLFQRLMLWSKNGYVSALVKK